jgi:FKBP-type peptidyl-prolyl cis-trans isomerase
LWGCQVETETDRQNAKADEQIQQYLTANKLSLQKSSTGLYYSITPANKSTRSPLAGETVSMYYETIRVADGLKIDSSETAKGQADYFLFGSGKRIAGLEEALSTMKEGDKATLVIPQQLAYADKGFQTLPPYSNIRMNIQLLKTRTELEMIDDYIADQKWTTPDIKTDTLRLIKTVTTTDTTQMLKGRVVTVKYTGKFLRDIKQISGTAISYLRIFDTGTMTITLGSSGTIVGFENGIKKMKLGEKAMVLIPSAFGYGTTGRGTIPAYTPLLFEVEVTKITIP